MPPSRVGRLGRGSCLMCDGPPCHHGGPLRGTALRPALPKSALHHEAIGAWSRADVLHCKFLHFYATAENIPLIECSRNCGMVLSSNYQLWRLPRQPHPQPLPRHETGCVHRRQLAHVPQPATRGPNNGNGRCHGYWRLRHEKQPGLRCY